MRYYILLVSFFMATMGCTQTATVIDGRVPIDIVHAELSAVTSSANFGNMLPISHQESILNLGYIKPCIIDNTTGKLLAGIDENPVKKHFEELLATVFQGMYSIPSEDQYRDIPSCQKYPFHYERFFKLDREGEYACLVSCWARKTDNPVDVILVRGAGFFDSNLRLTDFVPVDEDQQNGTSLRFGGVFYDSNTIITRVDNPGAESQSDFVLFLKREGRFERMGEITKWPKSKLAVYYPGRFFSIFKFEDKYYINNQISLERLNTISSEGETMNLPLGGNECAAIIEPVDNRTVATFLIELDAEGASRKGRLVVGNIGFSSVRLINEYNLLKYTINSVKAFDGVLYVFLFDRQQGRYLIDRIVVGTSENKLGN